MFFPTAPCFITRNVFCIQICFVGVTICLTSSVSLVPKTTFFRRSLWCIFLSTLFPWQRRLWCIFLNTLFPWCRRFLCVFIINLFHWRRMFWWIFLNTLFFDGEVFGVFSLALSFLDGEGYDEFSLALYFLKWYVKIVSIRRIFSISYNWFRWSNILSMKSKTNRLRLIESFSSISIASFSCSRAILYC